MKKKVITSAILTIALALSLLLGATYALFTSESRNSIEINYQWEGEVLALSPLRNGRFKQKTEL